MRKALAKRCADILEKLGVIGLALALVQNRLDQAVVACGFLLISCTITMVGNK